MKRSDDRGGRTVVLVALPVGGSASLSIRLGSGRWGLVAVTNLVSSVVAPTSYFWRCTPGPTSQSLGWAPPTRELGQEPGWPLGQTGGDQSNILPLDLTLRFLNFISSLGTHFITNKYTEHESS